MSTFRISKHLYCNNMYLLFIRISSIIYRNKHVVYVLLIVTGNEQHGEVLAVMSSLSLPDIVNVCVFICDLRSILIISRRGLVRPIKLFQLRHLLLKHLYPKTLTTRTDTSTRNVTRWSRQILALAAKIMNVNFQNFKTFVL
jgi:hypothetical protein